MTIKFNESPKASLFGPVADEDSTSIANYAQRLVDEGEYKTFGEALSSVRSLNNRLMKVAGSSQPIKVKEDTRSAADQQVEHRIIAQAVDAAMSNRVFSQAADAAILNNVGPSSLDESQVSLLLRICAGSLSDVWKRNVGPSLLHYAAVLNGNQSVTSATLPEPITLDVAGIRKLSDALGSLGKR
jgi:hypothetical protein